MKKTFIIHTGIEGMKFWNEIGKQIDKLEKEKSGLTKVKSKVH